MEEKIFNLINKCFVLAAILVVGLLIFMVGDLAVQNKIADRQNQYQVNVSGEGKIYAKPDIATTTFGVRTEAATVAAATESNTSKMNAVIDAIKKAGVDAKDIQTTNYSLSPKYEITPIEIYRSAMPLTSSSNNIIGYTLEQDVQVKIRDFSKISDVFSKATSAGANIVNNLQFTIDDPQQLKQQARAEAIKKAKDNASNLATASGIRLGKIINVYESYSPVYSTYAKGMGAGLAEDSAVPAPTIAPGQQEIAVTVNITYQVK